MSINNNKLNPEWAKFAGLASQWAIAIVLLLFFGKYLDKHFFLSKKLPLFIWILPFAFIIFSLIRIIRETKTDK